jgi:hypothetical protein
MTVLEILNLFFAGILAGLEIAAHYGFHGHSLALDDKSQIMLRQGLVRKLRWLVPAFFIPATLTAVALTVMSDDTTRVVFRLIALLAIAIWIYARVVVTVKINSASVDWNPGSPPDDWKSQINKAERFHVIGTWVTIIAFVCLLLAIGVK